ncbi:MAG: EscU/YscU/HrcU family type III secretion system export apparatus switch protein [Myxococcota bacterium]|nr:EscU/YscU/HrcU family type III secretion system export apparatus switch protein [Myxococcota bacterium]
MADESGEKTEDASPHKLREARKKGQVAKSTDFTTGIVFGLSITVLFLTLPGIGNDLKAFVVRCFSLGLESPGAATISLLMSEAHGLILSTIMPLLGVAVAAAVIGNFMQFGFMFTTKPLQPELKKINPVQGAKNLISKKKLMQMVLSILKFAVVGYLVMDEMGGSMKNVVRAGLVGVEAGAAELWKICLILCIKVAAFLFAVGVLDRFWQMHVFAKEQRMSKHDVKQEYKQTEGDPHIKGQRKQLAEELLMHGSIEDVKNADVVVVNPEHIAVALRYNDDEEGAPRLMAKGQRVMAEKIKEVARQFGVPIMRNVPLAHALHDLDIGEEIPEELYEAVAEVLNFVYELESQEAERRKRR